MGLNGLPALRTRCSTGRRDVLVACPRRGSSVRAVRPRQGRSVGTTSSVGFTHGYSCSSPSGTQSMENPWCKWRQTMKRMARQPVPQVSRQAPNGGQCGKPLAMGLSRMCRTCYRKIFWRNQGVPRKKPTDGLFFCSKRWLIRLESTFNTPF